MRSSVALPNAAVLLQRRNALCSKAPLLCHLRLQGLAFQGQSLCLRGGQVDSTQDALRGWRRRGRAARARCRCCLWGPAAPFATREDGVAVRPVLSAARAASAAAAAIYHFLLHWAGQRQQLLDAGSVLHLLQPQAVILCLQRQKPLPLLKEICVGVAEGLQGRWVEGLQLEGGEEATGGCCGARDAAPYCFPRTFCSSRTSSVRLRFSACSL